MQADKLKTAIDAAQTIADKTDATANGKTAAANFNIAKSATTQRWLILTAEEAQSFENSTIGLSKKELNDLKTSNLEPTAASTTCKAAAWSIPN